MTMSEDEQRSLGRIEGKLDSLIDRLDRNDLRSNTHSVRLGRLEKFQTRTTVFAKVGYTALAVVGGIAVKVLLAVTLK